MLTIIRLVALNYNKLSKSEKKVISRGKLSFQTGYEKHAQIWSFYIRGGLGVRGCEVGLCTSVLVQTMNPEKSHRHPP